MMRLPTQKAYNTPGQLALVQLSGRVVVFCKTAKSKRLKLCNTACVRKALGVLLCQSQADHPAASSEHDKRDGQAENILLCKQCI